jgi:hypothetical protein
LAKELKNTITVLATDDESQIQVLEQAFNKTMGIF